MMQYGKHALSQNARFSRTAYSVAIQMNVFLNVFDSSKQFMRIVRVRWVNSFKFFETIRMIELLRQTVLLDVHVKIMTATTMDQTMMMVRQSMALFLLKRTILHQILT